MAVYNDQYSNMDDYKADLSWEYRKGGANDPDTYEEDEDEDYTPLVGIWGSDYDGHEDKIYPCPVCPECKAPLGKHKKTGKYHCYECGREVILDENMLNWYKDREGEKVETGDCINLFGCGEKGCMEIHYRKSPVTKEWRTAWGVCKKCGAKFIV